MAEILVELDLEDGIFEWNGFRNRRLVFQTINGQCKHPFQMWIVQAIWAFKMCVPQQNKGVEIPKRYALNAQPKGYGKSTQELWGWELTGP